jgi:hypothetical protein
MQVISEGSLNTIERIKNLFMTSCARWEQMAQLPPLPTHQAVACLSRAACSKSPKAAKPSDNVAGRPDTLQRVIFPRLARDSSHSKGPIMIAPLC